MVKRQSVFEDLIEISSRLKWQWGVGLAAIAGVRELFGVMTAEHVVGGFVVASG